jgi:hypothetical protein
MYGNNVCGSYKKHEFVAHSTEVNCVAIGGKSHQGESAARPSVEGGRSMLPRYEYSDKVALFID